MKTIRQVVYYLKSLKRNSTLFGRLGYGRKLLFQSTKRALFLFSCIPIASRSSFGYVIFNRSGFYRPASSASSSIQRSFRFIASIATPKMVKGKNIDGDIDVDRPKTRKRRSATTTEKSNDVTETQENDATLPEPTKKRRSTSTKATPAVESHETKTAVDDKATEVPAKKVKPPSHQVFTDKDEIPKLWDDEKAAANGSYTFKVVSWNVAGLRAVLAKTPNVFVDLVKRHNVDVLCLQETKLQEQHLDDPKLKIKLTMGLCDEYDDYWSCSTARKGYSGTAVFVRRRNKSNGITNDSDNASSTKVKGAKKQTSMLQFVKAKAKDDSVDNKDDVVSKKNETMRDETLPIDIKQLIPTNIAYIMGKEKHDMEGRLIVLDYPLFTLCNVYVPNAGQQLERLSYRVNEWDKDFLNFMHQKQKDRDGLPVIWLGDLNVAHTNLEVWNDGAKHLAKQAGVTAEERASFQEQLDSGHIDAFRYLHPTAAGHYSYWSMRAGNRAVNKGLRLDYFICDPSLFTENSHVIVRDSYMDTTQEGSDHCPVILEMEIKCSAP